MRTILRILKTKQGMTMVEVLAGILLFTIIAASVTAVFLPILRMYGRSNELAEINTLLDNLSGEMVSALETASAISVAGGQITATADTGTVAYYVYGGADAGKKGVLCRTGDAPLLEKQYYKGKSVRLEYRAQDGVALSGNVAGAFYVRITILSDADDTELANREYAVNPLSVLSEQYKVASPGVVR